MVGVDRPIKAPSMQGIKIFQYCTRPAGRVTYNFHSSCIHMHSSLKIVCNKENGGGGGGGGGNLDIFSLRRCLYMHSRGQKFHSSACIYEWILERTSDSFHSTRPLGRVLKSASETSIF